MVRVNQNGCERFENLIRRHDSTTKRAKSAGTSPASSIPRIASPESAAVRLARERHRC
jgi:hypothetical protein